MFFESKLTTSHNTKLCFPVIRLLKVLIFKDFGCNSGHCFEWSFGLHFRGLFGRYSGGVKLPDKGRIFMPVFRVAKRGDFQ